MILNLWFYSYLLLVTIMLDFAMTTQHPLNSQGYKIKLLSESTNDPSFCDENIKSLLNYNYNKFEILTSLSSTNGPLPLNHNFHSSRNVSLPQGSLNVITLTPYVSSKKIQRISSDTVTLSDPKAGCISLLNYYWRYNVSFSIKETLLGVQIFIFHLYNDSNAHTNVNLNILLHSTQDEALLRPIVIVLSSFLPRRFYVSVLSYLSHTQQPIHILMTNSKSDVIFVDKGLRDTDLSRIFISVLDKSYNKILQFKDSNSFVVLDKNLEDIRTEIIQSNLYKYGYFSGFRYNSISYNKFSSILWLFDNGIQYSKRKPSVKIVVMEIIQKNTDINVILGKAEKSGNHKHAGLYNEDCIIVKTETYDALEDRVAIFSKTKFPIDESRTCLYSINQSSLLVEKKFKSVTWLHFEELSNITLKLTSDRFSKDNRIHLVILTIKNSDSSVIILESFFLHKRVQILTNISLNHFYQESTHYSFLISLQSMNAPQSQNVANYIKNSSSAVMQTTIYKLKSSTTYEIQVNVDDSQVQLYENVVVNPTCMCNMKANISLSLNLEIWKQINSWTPTEFKLGKQGFTFTRVNDTFVTLMNPLAKCSILPDIFRDSIYGIWQNYMYVLYLPFTFRCMEHKKDYIIDRENESFFSTTANQESFIPESKQGFHVFNDSKFTNLLKTPLHRGGRVYIQILQSIANEISENMGVQLRDCYITNQMVSEDDLNYSTEVANKFKKIQIIKNGCINQSSPLYSNVDKDVRPLSHYIQSSIMYRFSVGVDADNWASNLALKEEWMQQDRLEIHLYCGINRCVIEKAINNYGRFSTAEKCRPKNGCFDKLLSKQIFRYYGVLKVVKELNMTWKLFVLIFLNVIIVVLLICLVLFLWRLHKFHSKFKHSYSLSVQADHWRVPCTDSQIKKNKKLKTKSDYHSLKLLSGTQRSVARLYSDRNPQSSHTSSLQQLNFDSDRSIILKAGYLSSMSNKVLSSSSDFNRISSNHAYNSRLLSHSISELCLSENVPIVVDRALYSWPLSSADRHRRSHHSQPPPPRQCSFRSSIKQDCYRLTLSNKLKISVLFTTSGAKSFSYSSNPKLSSNRTTVSGGESASVVSDMPNNFNNKSHRWWSPLSNCSINNTFVMSRN